MDYYGIVFMIISRLAVLCYLFNQHATNVLRGVKS